MTDIAYEAYAAGQMPTSEEMTNLYLYGQKDKPDNRLDPSTWANYAHRPL